MHGEGTFRAGDDTNPYVGERGELHYEQETRIEVILPVYKQSEVLRALISVHPYEEPAYDFYALTNVWEKAGSGIVGTLPEEMDEDDFLYLLKDTFHLNIIQHSALRGGKPVRDVAICSGSGAFLIPKAISYSADVFITGEAKYNDFYDVEDKILLALWGGIMNLKYSQRIFFSILFQKNILTL